MSRRDVSVPADDSCTVECPCVLWNGVTLKHWTGEASFMAYLCETCDNVHVSVASPQLGYGLVQINASLPPKDAERLASLLLNPQVQKWEPG